jgi:hypothetical protein
VEELIVQIDPFEVIVPSSQNSITLSLVTSSKPPLPSPNQQASQLAATCSPILHLQNYTKRQEEQLVIKGKSECISFAGV